MLKQHIKNVRSRVGCCVTILTHIAMFVDLQGTPSVNCEVFLNTVCVLSHHYDVIGHTA